MRTGGRTSLTIFLREERTVWWWSPMRTANGTMCPATTSCPTSARKAQVCERTGEKECRRSVFSILCAHMCVVLYSRIPACLTLTHIGISLQGTFKHLQQRCQLINATCIWRFELLSHLIVYHILKLPQSFIYLLERVSSAFYFSFWRKVSLGSSEGGIVSLSGAPFLKSSLLH